MNTLAHPCHCHPPSTGWVGLKLPIVPTWEAQTNPFVLLMHSSSSHCAPHQASGVQDAAFRIRMCHGTCWVGLADVLTRSTDNRLQCAASMLGMTTETHAHTYTIRDTSKPKKGRLPCSKRQDPENPVLMSHAKRATQSR